MMRPIRYSVKGYDEGKEVFEATIKWTDVEGEEHVLYYNGDLDSCETTIGLLTGNICFADLQP